MLAAPKRRRPRRVRNPSMGLLVTSALLLPPADRFIRFVSWWGCTTACKLQFHLSYYKHLTVISTIPCPLAGYNESQNDHAEPWIAFHDRIKLPKVKISKSKILGPAKEFPAKRPGIVAALAPDQQLKVSAGINKNLILSEYQEFCIKKGHND